MADTQEETPAAAEETQPAAEESAPQAEEPAAASEETQEAAPEEGAAPEKEAAAEGEGGAPEEPPAEQETTEQKPEGEADEEAKPEEQAGGEGQEEGEQKEGGEGGEEAVAAAEQQQQEGGEGSEEPAAAVDGVDQPDGAEQPAEPAEGGEQVGEGAEPGQEVERAEGVAQEQEGQAAEEEAKEGGEQAEGEGEPKEGEAGEGEEQKEGEGEAAEAAGDGQKEGEEGDEEKKDGEEGAQEVPEGEEAREEEQERTESPVAVGEKLSRGGTPDVTDAAAIDQERLEATTPDRLDEEGQEVERVMREQELLEEEEEEEEEMEEEPAFRREELIERYHEALAEREQYQQQNYGLQHRLAEYFRKKKADERQDYDKNVTDQEQRYLKYMANLEDLRRQDAMEKENFRALIEDAKMKCEEKKEKVDLERKKFMEFKKQVALNAINSRSGKPIPPKDIEQYMVNEVRKEQEVIVVRLENIKLKNKLKKKEQQLKSKEELAEGLHLIDFEQLKIENQTYNEKIEERNEELLKLRKKITGTVQVLTHLKEKLQFVQGENSEQCDELHEVEASLAQSRDILSRTKQARDALRIDNQKLRQNCGLLGNEPLLRDFEERKDEGDELRGKLEQLKMKHAELTLHCNQVRRKIDQARQAVV